MLYLNYILVRFVSLLFIFTLLYPSNLVFGTKIELKYCYPL